MLSAEPVCSCAHFFVHIAHETAGAARTRSSLRPLRFMGVENDARLGRIAPRERGSVSACCLRYVSEVSPRHCERSEAIHRATRCDMDCFVASAPRNDVERAAQARAAPHDSLRLLRSLSRASASSCTMPSKWLRISSLWRLASLPRSATVSAMKATASSGPPSPSGSSAFDRRSLPEAVRFRPPPALLKKITSNPAQYR
jgi:hypothetical protein